MFTRSAITGRTWTDLDKIWSTLSTLSEAGRGRFLARSAPSCRLRPKSARASLRTNDNWTARRNFVFFLSVKQRTISPISRLSNFTKFEHMKSIGFAMKICGTKNANVSRNFLPLATSGRHNSAIITDRRKFTTKITLYEISSFHFTVEINSKSFPWLVYSVQQTSPNLLRRPTQVDNTVDNADITQSQGSQSPSNLSHVTLGLVEWKEVNSLGTDSRALRTEYCIVCISHNTVI